MTRGEERLAGRLALITGGSRGIGAAVAKRFAEEGARLILVARTQGALEEIDDEIRQSCGAEARPTLVPMDIGEREQLDLLAPAVAQRFGKLDILVGNAAILGTLGPVGDIDPEGWNRLIAVNLTANWHLIRAFGPPLRASDAGRAIFVTSGVSRGAAYWGGYATTKAALEALVRSWAAETTKTRLRVNAIDPGTARTRMRAEAFPGEDPETLRPPEAVADVFVELAAPDCTRHGEVVRA